MPFSLAIPDIIVVAILLVCAFFGAQKGFVRTFFDFFSFLLALFAANLIHPTIVGLLRRGGGLYDYFKEGIADSLNLNTLAIETGKAAETRFIHGLPLPSFITEPMIENNNPEIYRLLNVETIGDYAAGFMANLIISAIALLAAFLIAMIGIRIIAGILDILSKLPIVNTLNRTGGALAGFGQGVVTVWILIAVFSFFFARSDNPAVYNAIEASAIARYFYDNNLILNMILSIFP